MDEAEKRAREITPERQAFFAELRAAMGDEEFVALVDLIETVATVSKRQGIREAEERGRREERRACAEIAREQLLDGPGNAGEAIAKAIEARGGEG